MIRIWDESRIRDELRILDQKTGLCGAELPIVFNNAKRTLGSFSAHNGKAKQFCFSNYYFKNQEFPIEEALDVIKHEYAHYMDFVFNGNLGHSKSWKQCCTRIGALPIRLYSEERADYHRKKHEKECQEKAKLAQISPGTIIEHPHFGYGIVLSAVETGSNQILLVDFSEVGNKDLSALWVLNNCKFKSNNNERQGERL